jgi:DNA polymerase III subunit delta'
LADHPECHDSLPDTPPPQANRMLFGHQRLLDQLLAAHQRKQLHHAMLLSGEPGIGKATLAFAFARAVHMSGGEGGSDDSAAKIANNSHGSVLHVTRSRDDASKPFRTAIAIGDIHRMSHFLAHTAGGGGPRIVVIDSVGDMTISAANALLKNLEEPPQNTYFFLIAQSGQAVLPTIRSRCRFQPVAPLQPSEVAQALTELGYLPDEAHQAAKDASGSVREAIMQARFGGADLALALNRFLARTEFMPSLGMTLANAVSERDSEQHYTMLMGMLEKRVAARAREAAIMGQGDASDLATQHALMVARRGLAESFNLDRRLEVLNLLKRLHPVLA